MPIKQNIVDIFRGEMISKEIIDTIFNDLENQLLDMREVVVDMKNISFISVYFLERLEKFLDKAKELNIQIKIVSVIPEIYKVFQIRKNQEILFSLN